MAKQLNMTAAPELDRQFHEQYTTDGTVKKYLKNTAGYGISYLLEHDYGQLYREVIDKYIPKERRRKGLRVWEFGCGGGMNLIHIVATLQSQGIPVEAAYGTDFSEALISEAEREKGEYLPKSLIERVRFCVGRNEGLIEDASKALGVPTSSLVNSFDLVVGVNTIRYNHRLKTEGQCVATIRDLLAPGGVCIVIDMNQKFPAFRSRVQDKLTKEPEAYRLPSLSEYAQPFSAAGLEILRTGNFCWIPHSAGRVLTGVMRAAAPILNAFAPSRAMRSLVISRKPA